MNLKIAGQILFLFIFLYACENDPVSNCQQEDPKDLKILFIGNSYTEMGNANLPAAFAAMARAEGRRTLIGKAVAGGKDLYYHSTSEWTEDQINLYYWDYVILQGSSLTITFPDSFNIIFNSPDTPPIKKSIQVLKSKIKSHKECTKIIFFMPWAYEDGITWIPGRTEDYFAMQTRIIENSKRICKELDIICAPIGKAFETVMQEDNGLHYLFLPDYSHPSIRGTYLSAAVIYSTIYRDSVTGNSYNEGVTLEEARHFQEVATETVLGNKSEWNLH